MEPSEVKLIVPERRLVVARGWGSEKMEEILEPEKYLRLKINKNHTES